MKILKNQIAKLIGIMTLVAASTLSFGQDLEVKPLKDFYQDYNDRHRIILKHIEDQTEWSLARKLAEYETELTKLKTEFKTKRQAEYSSKSIKLSVSHSCNKGYSGGVKDCGWKSVNAPNNYVYTRTDWIFVTGTNKGTSVSPNGNSASLKMTRAGRGRNAGTLSAVFRYRPDSILELTEKETIELFNSITKA